MTHRTPLMRSLLLLAALGAAMLAACSKDATAPAPIDPPAMVHVINLTGTDTFTAWTVVIGSDLNHSGIANQGESYPGQPIPLCLFTSQVQGERHFIEAAVTFQSSLDTFLRQDHSPAFYDSLAKGTLTIASLLTAHPGLIAATAPFDPAPAGFAFPPDTVPWKWTVNGANSTTIAVDTSDHACRP